MKVLVTGGAGFIGSHIVDVLVKNNYDVFIIDNMSTGSKKNIPSFVQCYETDISSKNIEFIFRNEKPDIVIHHAANVDVSTSMKKPLLDAKNNIMDTINLLENCVKFGVQKIIYASSCAVYGDTGDISILETNPINPISFYGISKYTPEFYIRKFSLLYDLKYSTLRYSNVYGPRQYPKGEGGVISIFFEKLLTNEQPFIFGDGNQTRDFIYVKDVAVANMLAINNGDNEIINISSNNKTSIIELYEIIASLISSEKTPQYKEDRPGDIIFSRLNNQKAMNILNWVPSYDLLQGLKETYEYYRINKYVDL